MEQIVNKIYATVTGGRVTRFFSSVFETPKEGDILVEQGNHDYHAHVHLKYWALDRNGCHNYKVADGRVVPTTEEEKAAERTAQAAPPPSVEERLAAVEALQLEQLLGGSSV